MRKILAVGVLLLMLTGCSNSKDKVGSEDLEEGMKRAEELMESEWGEEEGEYRDDERGYFVEGTVLDITAVQLGEDLRVTVNGMEWLSEEEYVEESEGVVDIGHSDLKERPFVRVIDYSVEGEILKDKKY